MRSLLGSLRMLFPLLRLPRWAPAILILLGLLTALSDGLSMSLIVPLVQSQANPPVGGSWLWQWIPAGLSFGWMAFAIVLCVVLKNVLAYAYSLVFQHLNNTVSHRLRCGIVRQLLSVSQSFLDSRDPGKLLNTLGTETWRVTFAFATVAGLVVNLSMTLIFGILLVLISWKLTLLAAASMLGISLVIQALTRHVQELGAQATAANAAMAQRALEILSGLRLVRLFGRERSEQRRFDDTSQQVGRTFFAMERAGALVAPVSEVLTFVLLLGILMMASQNPRAMGGALTFLLLLYRLHPRIKQLDSDRVALQAVAASIAEVGALLDPTDKTYLRGGTCKPAGLQNGLVFENVCLRYESAKGAALQAVNLTIAKGQTTAIVGPSGAGKSSLIGLICRLYDPTAGRLLVDGIPLPALELEWWRSQIAVVSQEMHLFNTTVAENIGYGRPDASREQIEAAALKAHALEFITELAEGFDTVVGDRGTRLSGGQRQRLALARAFIRDPQILILDEATNSLDFISERLIDDALEQFSRQCTVVIVAHRIHSVKRADRIVVLEAGRVVENGTFCELLARGGLFSRLAG